MLHCVWLFGDPMDYSPPGSSVHGISQARILEWVAISYSRGSAQPRDWTWVSCVSCTGMQILNHWCHREAQGKCGLLELCKAFMANSHTAFPSSSISKQWGQIHFLPLTHVTVMELGFSSALDCYSGKIAMWPYPFIWLLLCRLTKRKWMTSSGHSSSTEFTPN